MMHITGNFSIAIDGDAPSSTTLADILSAVNSLKEIVIMNNEQLTAKLNGVESALTEASGEIVAKIAELVAALAAANVTSPEVDAKVDEVSALATALANIVPGP